MREIELKAVVGQWDLCCRRVEEAGGLLTFDGRMEDRRYDTRRHSLSNRDHVLRVRVYYSSSGETSSSIDWKGATEYENGFKIREEISVAASPPQDVKVLFRQLGYIVTTVIDRQIMQYQLDDAVVRFERYPRMDDLVEVEGQPSSIERAIRILALPRESFTSERLLDFVQRFEARSGERAALCDAELKNRTRSRRADA
ncbi:MAG: CYTH domain-containing protein [Anaerolineae bacterium]|nr:CYTH domain-containing protein [Gemmatimonadaceae bacterium]